MEERILGVYQANLDGVGVEGPSASSPLSQGAAATSGAAGSPAQGNGNGELSLEEVERLQFGDSFWGVT